MKAAHRVIVVCNAMDDITRIERGIETDSPAASRKVFQLCAALRQAGVRPLVLSLGRGRAGWSLGYFRRRVRRAVGVPVVYAPFSRLRWLSEFLSLLAPAGIAWRLRRRRPRATMIFYNRDAAHVPTLLAAALLRYPRVLDLEDGEVVRDAKAGRVSWRVRAIRALFDSLCSRGALLACSALERATAARPTMCYYGTASVSPDGSRWTGRDVKALMGGTLAADTGADTLIQAIRMLRQSQPAWASRLLLQITGKGPALIALQALAAEAGVPQVTVHGRTTDDEYRRIVESCEIGLALKPCGGPLADTTFPSKVVEMAGAGLLVLTTDISDVRAVLQDGALYLCNDEPGELIALLRSAVEDPAMARAMALSGTRAVLQRCAPDVAGRAVARFLFPAAA
jgi:glycosyltransferase involved in cell wall biosynthesis